MKMEFYTNFAADASYDPGPFLKSIDVPMYYAFGETDVNVPTGAERGISRSLA